METSILIVSKNRKDDLRRTLSILEKYIDKSKHEILVFLDGCTDNSSELQLSFPWVNWQSVEKNLGASKARNVLYKEAKGKILIGFDDDAHPLNIDFIERVHSIFDDNEKLGVIAFKEVKGIFSSDEDALKTIETSEKYYCREFIGCGFAIKKEVYMATNGFPVWVDIYGEEACVSLEVLSAGYCILFTTEVSVNHRVDKEKRVKEGNNYFRFQKQLKNATFYYLVYYKKPLKKIGKLYYHNFNKYGVKNIKYFIYLFKVLVESMVKTPWVLQFRKPVSAAIIKTKGGLKSPN